MSEESQVFRGDRAPELSKVDGTSAPHKKVPVQPSEAAPSSPPEQDVVAPGLNPEPVAEAPATPAPATAAPSAAAPEPELKLEVDPSQLWHASEALRQRIAQLHSSAVATSHVLDEQEAETRRIAKQLKSL